MCYMTTGESPEVSTSFMIMARYCCWTIDSGKEVGIWSEPWLSTSVPLAPVGPPSSETKDWKVCKLILPGTNDWDVPAIQKILPQYEDNIRSLVPSAFLSPDERVWLPNSSGVYSTNSEYALAKLFNGNTEDQTFNWKKDVWQIDTSPKIKHFLWKANSRALPVGSVLEKRGVSLNHICKRCGEFETEIHVLLKCPFAAKMVSLPPSGLSTTPVYPWILWLLWKNRNKLLFENRLFSEEDTVLKALQDARAWRAAQLAVAKPPLPQNVVSALHVPHVDACTWFSFSDAAYDSSTGNCGLGWHIRDPSNSFTQSSSAYWRFVPSALVAEALAVKSAMTAAISSHVSSLLVCSDSKNLVSLLKFHGQDVVLKGVLHDIRVLAHSFTSISFQLSRV
ncbi:hypothetical protein Bca4012_085217 [Brassica carinata]